LLTLPEKIVTGHGSRLGIIGLAIRQANSLIIFRINKPSLLVILATIKNDNMTWILEKISFGPIIYLLHLGSNSLH